MIIDPGYTNWKAAFTAPSRLNGIFLVASDNQTLIDLQISTFQTWFGSSITLIYKLQGGIRPAPYAGHESTSSMSYAALAALT